MTKRCGKRNDGQLFLASLGLAQALGDKQPSVTMAPVGNVQIGAGASASVEFDFRIGSEFHINSHHPKADYLIPTALKLNAPEQLTVADLKYPAGEEMAFAFSPDEKLSVYSGDFSINAVLKAPANAAAGNLSGEGRVAIPGVRPQRLLSAPLDSRAVPGDGGQEVGSGIAFRSMPFAFRDAPRTPAVRSASRFLRRHAERAPRKPCVILSGAAHGNTEARSSIMETHSVTSASPW